MERKGHKWYLSTGRELSTRGIVGIDDDLLLYEGYDGKLGGWRELDGEFEEADNWSTAERREVAQAMIQRWEEFMDRKG